MKFSLHLISILILISNSFLNGARIKDLTDVRGSRSNQLYGYGIVTGLAGQGDSRIEYTELGILNALETLGIRADKADKSRNIAAVMVTAEIGAFAKEGAKIDVTVSSIGNADSLQGGILHKPLCVVQTEWFIPLRRDHVLLAVFPLVMLAEMFRSITQP